MSHRQSYEILRSERKNIRIAQSPTKHASQTSPPNVSHLRSSNKPEWQMATTTDHKERTGNGAGCTPGTEDSRGHSRTATS